MPEDCKSCGVKYWFTPSDYTKSGLKCLKCDRKMCENCLPDESHWSYSSGLINKSLFFICNGCEYAIKPDVSPNNDYFRKNAKKSAQTPQNPVDPQPNPPPISVTDARDNSDTCNDCDYKATHKNALNEHTKNVHDAKSSPHQATPPPISSDDTCNVCEYKAININALNEHIKSVHDTKSSPLPKPNGVEAGTPDNPISIDTAPSPQNKSDKLCVHLTMYNNCKHGIVGKTCSYTHPKTCSKWKNFGSGKGGCSKGKDCKFFHQRLCNSVKNGTQCNRGVACKYVHPKTQQPKQSHKNYSPRNNPSSNPKNSFLGMRPHQKQVWNQSPRLGMTPDQNQDWNQSPNNQFMNSGQNQMMLNSDLIGLLRLLSQNMPPSQQGMVPVRVNF